MLREASKATGSSKVKVLINTHWHPDQTGSNERIGKSGATIIAHENTKLWLARPIKASWLPKPFGPLPEKARPNKTTYTHDTLSFAGQDIEYGYLLQAHTDGDLYVYFKNANVLVAGGVVSAEGWPQLDWETGGWIAGLVAGYDKLLKVANADTKIIPANGPVLTRGDLEGHRKMYMTIYERLVAGLNKGLGPEEVVASAPRRITPRSGATRMGSSRRASAACGATTRPTRNHLDAWNGCAMENASARMPRSMRLHATGAATGKPGRARGEYGPIVVRVRKFASVWMKSCPSLAGSFSITRRRCRAISLRQVVSHRAEQRHHYLQAIGAGQVGPAFQSVGGEHVPKCQRRLRDRAPLDAFEIEHHDVRMVRVIDGAVPGVQLDGADVCQGEQAFEILDPHRQGGVTEESLRPPQCTDSGNTGSGPGDRAPVRAAVARDTSARDAQRVPSTSRVALSTARRHGG